MHCLNACDAPDASLLSHEGTNSNSSLLEQFVALARTKNFTRAAEELNLSQSALSRAIQKLEEQLGQPLFERKPREVVLTDLGELLLERAKHILKLMEDTFSELSEAGRRGRIRLGAIPTIAPYFLPGLLSSFAKKHPDISVIVQEDTTEISSSAAAMARSTSPSSPCRSSPSISRSSRSLRKNCCSCARRSSARRSEEVIAIEAVEVIPLSC
jgi:predicted transcriptional regulator